MRIYRGWKIVAAAIAAYILVIGATTNIFGLFVVPVSEELGLSRATMNSAFVLRSIGSAVLAPVIGRLLDKFPARPIVAVSTIMLGAGFVILGTMDDLWLSVVALAVLIPVGLDGTALITFGVLVTRWFKIHRARALAVSAIGMSLSGAITPPLAALLIENCGWRAALVTTGITLTVLFLLLTPIIRDRPGPADVEPGAHDRSQTQHAGGDSSDSEPASLKDVMRIPEFWVLGVIGSVTTGIVATVTLSLVPLGMDRGLTLMDATSLMVVTSVTAVMSKLTLAMFGDRVDKLIVLTAMLLCGFVMNASLMVANDYWPLFICAALLGFASGAWPPLEGAILADLLGVKSFGTVRGLLAPLSMGAVAGGMLIAGRVRDQTGSYAPLLLAFSLAALILAGSTLAFRAHCSRKRARSLQPI